MISIFEHMPLFHLLTMANMILLIQMSHKFLYKSYFYEENYVKKGRKEQHSCLQRATEHKKLWKKKLLVNTGLWSAIKVVTPLMKAPVFHVFSLEFLSSADMSQVGVSPFSPNFCHLIFLGFHFTLIIFMTNIALFTGFLSSLSSSDVSTDHCEYEVLATSLHHSWILLKTSLQTPSLFHIYSLVLK